MIDNYKTLGLNNNASLEEIKKSWRILVLRYHPDRNKNHDSIKFREITEAYEALYNERKNMMEPKFIGLFTSEGKVEISTPDEFSFVQARHASTSFSGTLRLSQNSQYSVIFSNGYLDMNGWVRGEVWLVEIDNLICIKEIERPSNAAVSDNGTVAFLYKSFRDKVMDLGGSLVVANKSGEMLFTFEFGSNVEACTISPNGDLVSVATLYPDNSIYFFDVLQKILLWKYKSHLRRDPILELKFRGDQLEVFTGHTVATKEKRYTLEKDGSLTIDYQNLTYSFI